MGSEPKETHVDERKRTHEIGDVERLVGTAENIEMDVRAGHGRHVRVLCARDASLSISPRSRTEFNEHNARRKRACAPSAPSSAARRHRCCDAASYGGYPASRPTVRTDIHRYQYQVATSHRHRDAHLLEAMLQHRGGLDLCGEGARAVREGVVQAERAGGVCGGDGFGGSGGDDPEAGFLCVAGRQSRLEV